MCYPTSNVLPLPSPASRRAPFGRADAFAITRASAIGALALAADGALSGLEPVSAAPGPAMGLLLGILHAVAYWWVTRRALEVRTRATPLAWSILATSGLMLLCPDWIPAAGGIFGASLLAVLASDSLTHAKSPD